MVDDSHAPRQSGNPSSRDNPSDRDATPRTGRRRLFWAWVGITAAIALYVGVAGPFVSYFHEDMWLVAVVGPPLMIVLLSSGLGWLAWWVFGTRKPDRRP